MGGRCIYCGDPTVDSGHLPVCAKYAASIGGRRTVQVSPSTASSVAPDTPCQGGNVVEETLTPAVRGVPQHCAPDSKRQKTCIDEFVLHCLACGQRGCRHEDGFLPVNNISELKEHDPLEPDPHCCPPHSNSAKLSFDELKTPVRVVVAGIMKSSGIWSRHKYVGNRQLESKLKTWMRNRLDEGLVDSNWRALRQAVKEALRSKRQRSVGMIRAAFSGEKEP